MVADNSEEGDDDEAEAVLKRSLVIDPKCTIAKNNLKALPETRLHGTTMQFSNQSEVNLSHATLLRTDLSLSCLSRANLRDARVLETNLSHVDLSQTDLRDAHLNQSSLRQADLCGANLKGALVTAEQLAQVISLQNTIMPDGSIHLLKLPRAKQLHPLYTFLLLILKLSVVL